MFMKHRNLKFILMTAASLPMLVCAQEDTAQEQTAAPQKTAVKKFIDKTHLVSEDRKTQIGQILEQAVQEDLDLSAGETISTIEKRIAKILPLKPALDLQDLSLTELDRIAAEKTAKKFSAELDAKAKNAALKKAEEKFRMVKPRTKITFKCERGPMAGQEITDIFYQATGRYAEIGSNRISFVDMTPEQRAMFDANANKVQREKYAAELLANYESKKAKEQESQFRKLLKEQQAENEKNGYIYDSHSDSWITARDYFQSILKTAQEKQAAVFAERAAKLAAEAEEKEKLAAEKATLSLGAANQDTSDEGRYKEIMTAVKKQWENINQTLTGIDANQGYGFAHWNVTRSEVAYIFSRDDSVEYSSTLSTDTLTLKNGFPVKVILSYENNKLNRVEEIYGDLVWDNDANKHQFDKLKELFHDRLGLAAEEKAQQDKDLFKLIEKGELKPEDLHKENDGSYIFVWEGKNARGTLTFSYDGEADLYKDVAFVKEIIKDKPAAEAEK